MGGCLLTLSGNTKAEVSRLIKNRLIEARVLGLVDERGRSPIRFNRRKGKYVAYVLLHS